MVINPPMIYAAASVKKKKTRTEIIATVNLIKVELAVPSGGYFKEA